MPETHNFINFRLDKEFYDDLIAIANEEYIKKPNTLARMIICQHIHDERKKRGVKTISGGEPIE